MKLPFMTSSLSTSSLWGPPDRRQGRRGAKPTLFGDQPIPAAILRFGRPRPLVEAVAKLPLPLPKEPSTLALACLAKLHRRPFDLHLRAVGGQSSHRFDAPTASVEEHATASHGHEHHVGVILTHRLPTCLARGQELAVSRAFHSCVPARRLGGSAGCAHRQAVRTLRRRVLLTQPTLVLGLPAHPAMCIASLQDSPRSCRSRSSPHQRSQLRRLFAVDQELRERLGPGVAGQVADTAGTLMIREQQGVLKHGA